MSHDYHVYEDLELRCWIVRYSLPDDPDGAWQIDAAYLTYTEAKNAAAELKKKYEQAEVVYDDHTAPTKLHSNRNSDQTPHMLQFTRDDISRAWETAWDKYKDAEGTEYKRGAIHALDYMRDQLLEKGVSRP